MDNINIQKVIRRVCNLLHTRTFRVGKNGICPPYRFYFLYAPQTSFVIPGCGAG
jgi:hypothetical protein